jgi:ATP-dependent RNA/DNA helicase IGHMBP2
MDAQSYFNALSALQEAERRVEEAQFESALKHQSLQQQLAAGLCWHPLNIIETGYGFGDYPFVWVERTQQRDMPHLLGPGKPVRVFSAQQGDADAVNGVIDVLRDNRAKIVFFRDDMPEVLDEAKLVLQAQFDELSYKRTDEALTLIKNARNCRLAELRDVLIFQRKADTDADDVFEFAPDVSLNDAQNKAVRLMVETRDVALVHGPPGTGKTTTLVAAAAQICAQDGRILFVAPSNAAVDHLCISLHERGLNVLRIGNPLRVSEQLESLTLEGKLKHSDQYGVIREARKQADNYRVMALKYKRSFGAAEREQRNLLLKEAKALVRDALQLEKSLCDAFVHQADVICGTPMAVHTHLPKELEFDYVCIDEAAQALEPQCWLPVMRAQRLIMAGDPFQLPPTVKSDKAAKEGLSLTLMEKLLNRVPTVLLDVQYRMNPEIMAFPNRWFYADKLVAHSSTERRYFKEGRGVLFVDTAGAGYDEEHNAETQSVCNQGEAEFIIQRFTELLNLDEHHQTISAALIAPYSEQVRLLNTQFEEVFQTHNENVRIQTIDSFQGQERDAVIISLVRSNTRNEIGFLRDYRRMNVAMTRARYKLVMVGDSATLSADPFYDALINWSMEQGFYRSVWEFIS